MRWFRSAFLTLLCANCLFAAKDVVVTTTGDRLVGEIKRLDKKVLVLSTDYSDSDFKIKWEKVARIESERTFLVETYDDRRTFGSLKPEDDKAPVATIAGEKVSLPEVALIEPFERSLWSRFDTGFSLGLSGTRANGAKQFNASGNLVYRDDRNVVNTTADAFASRQDNAPRTRRWEVANEYRRLLGSRWYASGATSFLSSDEQNLSLRTSIGGGIGRYLIRSRSQYLATVGGIAWTNENYRDNSIPRSNSAEAFVGAEFVTERFKAFDWVSRLTFLPSLTIAGRYRSNYRTDFDFNLPGDWFLRTGFYGNFDSKPPNGLSKSDYGWTNSFGLKF
jgi:hypothetical protein